MMSIAARFCRGSRTHTPLPCLIPASNTNTNHEQGRLEAYQNVEERWRVVLRGAGAIETEANTPLEPDRAVALGDGAALAVTAVDDAHVVQGASFRRKTTGSVSKRAFFPP